MKEIALMGDGGAARLRHLVASECVTAAGGRRLAENTPMSLGSIQAEKSRRWGDNEDQYRLRGKTRAIHETMRINWDAGVQRRGPRRRDQGGPAGLGAGWPASTPQGVGVGYGGLESAPGPSTGMGEVAGSTGPLGERRCGPTGSGDSGRGSG
jgi:hypothetical protein